MATECASFHAFSLANRNADLYTGITVKNVVRGVHIIYSFTQTAMTLLEWVELHVCTFCYASHQHYAPNLPFNNAQKEVVSICACCGEGMCKRCLENSREELGKSVLVQYWFEICRTCIATVRRNSLMKRELEGVAKEAAFYVKSKIKERIYSLTKRTCLQS